MKTDVTTLVKVMFLTLLIVSSSVLFIYTRKIEVGDIRHEVYDITPEATPTPLQPVTNITSPENIPAYNLTLPQVEIPNFSLPSTSAESPKDMSYAFANQFYEGNLFKTLIMYNSDIPLIFKYISMDSFNSSSSSWSNLAMVGTLTAVNLSEPLSVNITFPHEANITTIFPLTYALESGITHVVFYLPVPIYNFTILDFSLVPNLNYTLMKDRNDNYLLAVDISQQQSLTISVTYRVGLNITTYDTTQSGLVSDIPPDYVNSYTTLPSDILTSDIFLQAYTFYNSSESVYNITKKMFDYFQNEFVYDPFVVFNPSNYSNIITQLLDTHVGNSIYFATTMTVFLRCIGVPARFILGTDTGLVYRNITTGLQEHNEILTSNLRAFVEVYIPNLGWVYVDPTPKAEISKAISYAMNPYVDGKLILANSSYFYSLPQNISFTYSLLHRDDVESTDVLSSLFELNDFDVLLLKMFLNNSITSYHPIGVISLNLTVNTAPLKSYKLTAEIDGNTTGGFYTDSTTGSAACFINLVALSPGTHVLNITTKYIFNVVSFERTANIIGHLDPNFVPTDNLVVSVDSVKEKLFSETGWVSWNLSYTMDYLNNSNEIIVINGTLYGNGNPYSGGNITVYDYTGGNTYLLNNLTSDNGTFIIYINTTEFNILPGDHFFRVVLEYTSWKVKQECETLKKLFVYASEGVSIRANVSEAIIASDVINFTLSFWKNSTPIENASIRITDLTDNVTLGNVTTDSNGEANLTYIFPYSATATYHTFIAECENYSATIIILAKLPPVYNFTVNVTPEWVFFGNNFTFSILFNTSLSIENWTFLFYLNSSLIGTATTNTSGHIVFLYPANDTTYIGFNYLRIILKNVPDGSSYSFNGNITIYSNGALNYSSNVQGVVRGLWPYNNIVFNVSSWNTTTGNYIGNAHIIIVDETDNITIFDGFTNSSGFAIVSYNYSSDASLGTHQISFHFVGLFTPRYILNITVSDPNWVVDLSSNITQDIMRNYTVVEFTTYIHADQAPGSNFNVTVWDLTDNVIIGEGQTDSSGYFNFTYVFPYDTTLGIHTIVAVTEVGNSSQLTVEVVNEYSVSLSVQPTTAIQNYTVVAFLITTYKYEDPFGNGNITLTDLTDNEVIYTGTTNSSGSIEVQYIYPLSSLVGPHTIRVTFEGKTADVYISVVEPSWYVSITPNVTNDVMRNYTPVEFTIQLSLNGDPYADGNVSIIDVTTGDTLGFAVTNDSGIAIFTYTFPTPYPLGNHTIKVRFDYYTMHPENTCWVWIIPEYTVSFSMNVTEAVAGDTTILFTINITEYNQPASGNVTLYDVTDNVQITILTVTDGTGNTTYVFPLNSSLGNHTIRAIFHDTDFSDQIYVKSNTILNVSVAEPIIRGETVLIEGYLVRADGTPIASQIVNIYWNGSFIGNTTTNSNGYYSYSYYVSNTTEPGPITIFANTTVYLPYLNSSSNTINTYLKAGISVNLTTNATHYVRGQWVHISGTVILDNNTPVVNGVVGLYWDNLFLANVTTDTSGSYSYDYQINSTHPFVRVTITASYYGNSTLNSQEVTLDVYVQTHTSITLSSSTTSIVHGDSLTLNGTITDEDGNPIVGATIIIYYNISGTYYSVSAVSNSSGAFERVVDILLTYPGGVYNFTAHVDATNTFLANSSSPVFVDVYEPTQISISAHPDKAIRGQNVTIIARVTNDIGVPVVSRNVTFYWNGTNIGTNITDSNGYAYMMHQVPSDLVFSGLETPLYLNATFNATNHYYRSSNETEIKVVKAVIITLSTPGNEKYFTRGETITIYGVVTDENGTALSNEVVSIWYYHDSTETFYGNYTSDVNGNFQFNYTVRTDVSPGYTVFFNGTAPDEPYYASNKQYVVAKSSTSISYILYHQRVLNGSIFYLYNICVLDDQQDYVKEGIITIHFGQYEEDLQLNSTFFVHNWSYPISPNEASQNVDLYLSYQPSHDYYLSSQTTTRTISIVNEANLVKDISTNSFEIQRNHILTISGKLYDTVLGNLDNENITILFDNVTIGIISTDSNGVYSFNYLIPNETLLGEHYIYILLPYLENSQNVTKIKVVAYTTISANISKQDFISGEQAIVSGTLVDDLGTPLNDVITLFVLFTDTPSYDFNTTVNVINGTFSYTFTLPNTTDSTSFTVRVVYNGNTTVYGSQYDILNNYVHAYVTFVLLAEFNGTLYDNVSIARTQNVTILGVLKDEDGIFATNIEVRLVFNTQEIQIYTTNNSTYNLNYLFVTSNSTSLGKYVVSAYLPTYSNFASQNEIEIYVRAIVIINATLNKLNYAVGENVTIAGNLTDEYGNLLPISGTIILNVTYLDWGSYEDQYLIVVDNGRFSYTFQINPDSSTTTITLVLYYDGSSTTTYFNATKELTIHAYRDVQVDVLISITPFEIETTSSQSTLFGTFSAAQDTTTYNVIYNVTRGGIITITGHLYAGDTGAPIPNETVVLYININGWIQVVNKTGEYGEFVLSYQVPENISVGFYEVYLEIPQLNNGIRIPVNTNEYYYIRVYSITHIVIDNISSSIVTYGDTITITGRVVDSLNNTVQTGVIHAIYFNGNDTVFAIDNGHFTITLSIYENLSALGFYVVIRYDNQTSYLYYASVAPPLLIQYFQRLYLFYYVAPSVTDSGQPAIRITGFAYADGNVSRRVGNREIFVYLDNSSSYYTLFVTNESSSFNVSILLPSPPQGQISTTHTLTLKWLKAGQMVELEGGKITVRIVDKGYLTTLLSFGDIPTTYYSGASVLFYLSLVYFGVAVALTARSVGMYIIKKRREEQRRRKIRSIRDKVLDVLSLVDPEKAEEIKQKLDQMELDMDIFEFPTEVLEIPQIFLDLLEMLNSERYFDGIMMILDDYLTSVEDNFGLTRHFNETPREFGNRVGKIVFGDNPKKLEAHATLVDLYSRMAYSNREFTKGHLIQGIRALMRLYLSFHPEDAEKYTDSVMNWIVERLNRPE